MKWLWKCLSHLALFTVSLSHTLPLFLRHCLMLKAEICMCHSVSNLFIMYETTHLVLKPLLDKIKPHVTVPVRPWSFRSTKTLFTIHLWCYMCIFIFSHANINTCCAHAILLFLKIWSIAVLVWRLHFYKCVCVCAWYAPWEIQCAQVLNLLIQQW